MKRCSDLHKIVDFKCCESCHDLDEFEIPICSLEIDGEEYEVCCNGAEAHNKLTGYGNECFSKKGDI